MFGGQILPGFLPFLHNQVGVDTNHEHPAQVDIQINAPFVSHAFLEELGVQNLSRRSFMKWERVMHSHGHTF